MSSKTDRPLYPVAALTMAEAFSVACCAPGCWEPPAIRVFDREGGAVLCADHLLSRLTKRAAGGGARVVYLGESSGEPRRSNLDVTSLRYEGGALRAWDQLYGRWLTLSIDKIAEIP